VNGQACKDRDYCNPLVSYVFVSPALVFAGAGSNSSPHFSRSRHTRARVRARATGPVIEPGRPVFQQTARPPPIRGRPPPRSAKEVTHEKAQVIYNRHGP